MPNVEDLVSGLDVNLNELGVDPSGCQRQSLVFLVSEPCSVPSLTTPGCLWESGGDLWKDRSYRIVRPVHYPSVVVYIDFTETLERGEQKYLPWTDRRSI